MASMRKLNRRLARWQRYACRYRPGPWPRNHNVARCDIRDPAGFVRAYSAVWAELERRQLCELYDPGMYDDGRPCDCFDCRPDDDAGHGDSGWHLADEDDAYDGEGWPWPPGVVVVTEFSDRGLL